MNSTFKQNTFKNTLVVGFFFMFSSLLSNAQTINATLHIKLDCWGEETAWTLKNFYTGDIVASQPQGTYDNDFPVGKDAFTEEMFVEVDQCYQFYFYDFGGNGIMSYEVDDCMQNGSYALIALTGDTLASSDNVDFNWSEITVFCVKYGCTDPSASNYMNSATIDDGTCILPEPIANFSYLKTQGNCDFVDIQFKNESSFGLNFYWEFGNGVPNSSTEENPLVSFPTGSSPLVKLHVENDTGDDTFVTNLDVAIAPPGSVVTLYFQPDCWGEETAWAIMDEEGTIVRSIEFGTYKNSFPGNTANVIEENFCLPNGCYTFEIYDSNGDGLAGKDRLPDVCDIDGNFVIEDVNGDKLVDLPHNGETFGFTYTTTFCVDIVHVWNGSVSTNWDDPLNWDAGVVPGNKKDVYINSNGTPLVLEQDVQVRHLTIGANSTLDFAHNLIEMEIVGDLICHGNMDVETGTIIFKGASLGDETRQFIKGSSTPTFNRLVFDGHNKELVFLNDIQLKGTLLPLDGLVNFNNRTISLLSGENYQGAIGKIGGELVFDVNADATVAALAEVTGNIHYYRYFPAGNASWRMLSSPIVNATFEQWNDNITTTGFPGSDYPDYPSAANPWSNIRTYNETFNSGLEADRHFGFESVGSVNDVIDNKKGYFVYFVPSPTMIDMEGEFFRGLYEPELSYTPSDSGLTCDGWNLIANPYPCAIEWGGAGFSKANVDNAIYAYDPNLRQYSSYVNGVSTGILTEEIGSSQAFWVKANDLDPYLEFNESTKTSSIGVHMKQNDNTNEALIYIDLITESTLDKCVVGFNRNASSDFDSELDAFKFYGSDPNLPTLACLSENNEIEMSISMYPLPEGHAEIGLKIKAGNKSTFKLKNSLADSFDGNFCFLLDDKELNTILPFNEGDEYEFTVVEGSSLHDRFSVIVQGLSYASVTSESCPDAEDGTAVVNGFGEAPWSFVWKDEMNAVIRESSEMTDADMATDLAPGFYEVTVQNTQAQCNTASIVVQIPEAEQLSLSAIAIPASCNDASKAGIQIDLDERFTWDLTIEDESGKFTRQLSGLSADTLLTGFEINTYSVRAMSSCGNGMMIPNLDLSDPKLPKGVVSTNQPNNETYVGMPIELRYETEEKVNLEWSLENGDKFNGQFSSCSFNAPGEYKIEASIKNDHCKTTELITIKVNDLPNNQLAEESGEMKEASESSEITLSIQENALWMEFSATLNGPILFTVFNNNGQTVLEETALANDMLKHQLDLSGLTPGIYYLNVNDANGLLFSEKFIQTQ